MHDKVLFFYFTLIFSLPVLAKDSTYYVNQRATLWKYVGLTHKACNAENSLTEEACRTRVAWPTHGDEVVSAQPKEIIYILLGGKKYYYIQSGKDQGWVEDDYIDTATWKTKTTTSLWENPGHTYSECNLNPKLKECVKRKFLKPNSPLKTPEIDEVIINGQPYIYVSYGSQNDIGWISKKNISSNYTSKNAVSLATTPIAQSIEAEQINPPEQSPRAATVAPPTPAVTNKPVAGVTDRSQPSARAIPRQPTPVLRTTPVERPAELAAAREQMSAPVSVLPPDANKRPTTSTARSASAPTSRPTITTSSQKPQSDLPSTEAGVCIDCQIPKVEGKRLQVNFSLTSHFAERCTQFILDDGKGLGPWGQIISNTLDKPEYSAMTDSALLSKTGGITSICKNFNVLDKQQIKSFWIWLMASIAMAESSCNEKAINEKATNGTAVGLLQMDLLKKDRYWRDKVSGGLPHCRQDSVRPAENNINCGINILLGHIKGVYAKPPSITKNSYWHGLRLNNHKLTKLAKEFPPCGN